MTVSPVFVDANVPIYAVGEPSRFKEPCLRVLTAIGGSRGIFVTDAEAMQEVLHVLRRRRWTEAGPAFRFVLDVMGADILPVDGLDLAQAGHLAERYGAEPSTRDLVHAAVMSRHGIERVVTADRHFDGFEGVTRLDPARFAEWADPDWG